MCEISLVKKRVYGYKYSHIIILDGSVVNFYLNCLFINLSVVIYSKSYMLYKFPWATQTTSRSSRASVWSLYFFDELKMALISYKGKISFVVIQ